MSKETADAIAEGSVSGKLRFEAAIELHQALIQVAALSFKLCGETRGARVIFLVCEVIVEKGECCRGYS